MFRSRLPLRLTTVFVVAFICLNAGGAACVAFCQSLDSATQTEHSPLEKLSKHCNKAKNRASDSGAIVTTTGEADCCPFTISFVAAPVESNQTFPDIVAATPVPGLLPSPVLYAGHKSATRGTPYRGPPKDHRIERLKNCILRI
jgi:hypothetical protein